MNSLPAQKRTTLASSSVDGSASNGKDDHDNGHTRIKLMTKAEAARLAAEAPPDTKVTVFEYTDHDTNVPEDDDDINTTNNNNITPESAEFLTTTTLRPILNHLKILAHRIRSAHPNWHDNEILEELRRQEPHMTLRIGINYATILKFIASKDYTETHENILGYLLYIREQVEQRQITEEEANYRVAQDISVELQKLEEIKKSKETKAHNKGKI